MLLSGCAEIVERGAILVCDFLSGADGSFGEAGARARGVGVEEEEDVECSQ